MNADLLAAFVVGLLAGFLLATIWCRYYVDKRFKSGDGVFRVPKGVSHVSVTMHGGLGGVGKMEIEEVYK